MSIPGLFWRHGTDDEGWNVMVERVRWRLPVVITSVCLAMTGCAGDTPDTPDASESPGMDDALPAECSEWTEPPSVADPIDTHGYMASAAWEKVDGYLLFEASWVNTSDLVAVGLSSDLRIIFDGEDITGDLPGQAVIAEYNPYEFPILQPGERHSTGEIRIDLPPSPQWAESGGKRTELQAEPTIDRWCLPAEETI